MKAETKARFGNDVTSVDLRVFIDRVIVPALLERFLREHPAMTRGEHSVDLPKMDATV